ncbi:hypothetical protein GE09DRAFT_335906 [Coniochaeta sp. 2T2.1]|nr:hypothetical protein GE09DRAFT_335906 [Coniochaeta sp. 2T2.1]
MAEVLDLVVSIVELAGAIISTGKQLYEIFQEGPKELRAILLETASLKTQLEFVDLFTSSSAAASQENEIQVQVEHSRQIMEEIYQLLSRFTTDQQDKGRRAAAKLRDSECSQPCFDCRYLIRYVYPERPASKLTVGSMTVRNIANNVSQIKDMLGDGERRRILKELITVDPSSNHHEACHLHDSSTSAWITRTDEWKAWISGDLPLWWIDGIPGAGKTVLASHLIEEVKSVGEQQSSNQTIAWSYYYCYHARSHKSEDAPFLRWVVATLSRQAGFVPHVITTRDSRDVTVQNLWDALLALCARFEKVFVMVDALDESQDRPAFLKLLRRISSSVENASLLVTSRIESNIELALSKTSTRLSLSIPLHPELENDISEYIRSQLALETFQSWGEGLRAEVEHDLVEKSQGMFRWVACQLEILGRLKQASAIRRALADLPKSLDETYQRIICKSRRSRNCWPIERCHLSVQNLSTFSDIRRQGQVLSMSKKSFDGWRQRIPCRMTIFRPRTLFSIFVFAS